MFDRLRGRRDDRRVFLYAFDLIELNGEDLRRKPIEARKAALAKLLRHAKTGLLLNDHVDEPGNVVFRHACKMGLEGIVSKRLGSPYRSGRSRHWSGEAGTAAKTRRVTKANKRAQGRVGIMLANMSATPGSASRLGTKLEIHHGVAASNSGAWPALK